jgi:aminomethyltransferase
VTPNEHGTTAEAASPAPAATRLYFGPWYRRSPFFESTLRAGCRAYDIYNKMYLPAEYDDVEVEYWALNDGVTLWDVGVERTVQISGPDAIASRTCYVPRPDAVRGDRAST